MPEKSLCEREIPRIAEYIMKGFEKNLTAAREKKYSYMIQSSTHSICRDLHMEKTLVVFLLLGSNPIRPAWGSLNEKYGLDSVKYTIRNDVIARGKKVFTDKDFKMYFYDPKKNGDFRMRVEFFDPLTEEQKAELEAKEKDKENTWSKVVSRAAKKVAAAPLPKIPVTTKKSTTETPKTTSELLDRVRQLEEEMKALREAKSSA
jgi:hypothetical protein